MGSRDEVRLTDKKTNVWNIYLIAQQINMMKYELPMIKNTVWIYFLIGVLKRQFVWFVLFPLLVGYGAYITQGMYNNQLGGGESRISIFLNLHIKFQSDSVQS